MVEISQNFVAFSEYMNFTKNCSDLSLFKNFANSWPSAWNLKSFSRSLEYFFLTVGQNNFGKKIPIPICIFLNIVVRTRFLYKIKFAFPPFTAVLLFLSVCIFGGECWARDWLLYPNYNYVSWSYAFAVFSSLGHIIAAFFMFIDCQKAKERKEKNKVCMICKKDSLING